MSLSAFEIEKLRTILGYFDSPEKLAESDIITGINQKLDGVTGGYQGKILKTETPADNGFYSPLDGIIHPNFGDLEYDPATPVAEGGDQGVLVFFIKKDAEYSKISIDLNITFDAVPTDGSKNTVESGGVFDTLADKVDKSTQATTENIVGSPKYFDGAKTVEKLKAEVSTANLLDADQTKFAQLLGVNNEFQKQNVFETIAKTSNLLDSRPLAMNTGKRVSASGGISLITSTSAICATNLRKLDYNVDYVISGSAIHWGATPRAILFATDNFTDGESVSFTPVEGGFKFKPTTAHRLFFCVDLTVTEVGGDVVVGDVMLEKGLTVTEFKSYGYKFNTDNKTGKDLEKELEVLSNNTNTNTSNITTNSDDISENANEIEFNTDKSSFAITLANDQISPDSLFYGILKRITDWNFTLTKDLGFNKSRGYFFVRKMGRLDPSLPYNATTNRPYIFISMYNQGDATYTDVCRLTYDYYAIADASKNAVLFGSKNKVRLISSELNNSGMTGSCMSYLDDAFNNLKTNTYEITDVANVKFVLPSSSMFFEYEAKERISGTGNFGGLYNILPAVQDVHKKLPKFFRRHIKRDGNLNIILCGDSITARDYHTTYFSAEEQAKRPPLMVSKNIGSAIYDALTWENTEYAKFNRTSFFTESGATFLTVIANDTNGGGASNGISQGNGTGGDEWYDIGDRPADTRIYTGTSLASVAYDIPNDTYIANFIYRTDLKGCENVTVNLSVGNGKWQVFNGATWVEANGYVMSMRHGGNSDNRINTKFQERLRFRASDKYDGGTFDERATAGTTFTFTKDNSDSRFLYWGIEWSKEPYIVTVINAARGGENISTVLPAINDDIFDWIDTPDTFSLIIHEIYLNQGQNNPTTNHPISKFINEWEDYFYDDANLLSFREKSKVGVTPWQKFEAIQWNPNPTAESGGILMTEPYGWFTYDNSEDGTKSILDNFLCYLYDYVDNREEVGNVIVNVTNALIDEAKAKFGVEWYKAFIASSVTGSSFYNDQTHPNDYGVKVIMNRIFPWLKFYNL